MAMGYSIIDTHELKVLKLRAAWYATHQESVEIVEDIIDRFGEDAVRDIANIGANFEKAESRIELDRQQYCDDNIKLRDTISTLDRENIQLKADLAMAIITTNQIAKAVCTASPLMKMLCPGDDNGIPNIS